MTTTFTPGPVIAIEDGQRPWFVGDGDRLQWVTPWTTWRGWEAIRPNYILPNIAAWGGITHIRLDITHPESIRRTWNDAHPDETPFDAVWMGGDRAPDDWDGGEVLLKDIHPRVVASGFLTDHNWSGTRGKAKAFAYRRKPAAETEAPDDRMEVASAWELEPTDNAVRIERRTEAEWRQDWQSRGDVWVPRSENRLIALLRSLDLIVPEPTTTDRFMAAHPDADRRTAELFAAFGEAGR